MPRNYKEFEGGAYWFECVRPSIHALRLHMARNGNPEIIYS